MFINEVELLHENDEYVARYRDCEGGGSTIPQALRELADELELYQEEEYAEFYDGHTDEDEEELVG